jgi:phage host-nuclease inhibitor protein Gam
MGSEIVKTTGELERPPRMNVPGDDQTRQLQAVIGQLQRDLVATRQAHIEQVTDLNRHIKQLTEAAAERELKTAAEIAAIRAAYASQVQSLEQQIATLTEAAVGRETKIAAEITAIRAAYMAQIQQLDRQITELSEAATRHEQKYSADVEAITAVHAEQVRSLVAHNSALTEAATERARQLQREKETDYQLLMIHQNLLAEFRDMEPDFLDLYNRCKAFTMTSMERLYGLYKSVEYLSASGIHGDLAECGVWRGGSCMLMALVLLRLSDTGRRIIMFDTFEGHPRPDAEKDVDLWGNKAIDEWEHREAKGSTREWGFASQAETRANMISTGYPEERLVLVKGMVESRVPENTTERLALLRLDTDWYHSARVALRHLYPKLMPGGVLIIDDYGHYKGQREAVDEYFREIGCTPLLHRIDYSCRVMVKAMAGSTGNAT